MRAAARESAPAGTQVDIRWERHPNPYTRRARTARPDATSIRPLRRRSRPGRTVLVGRAAADADPTDLHLVRGHDWHTPGKQDDARNLGYPAPHAGLARVAEGQPAELASRGANA